MAVTEAVVSLGDHELLDEVSGYTFDAARFVQFTCPKSAVCVHPKEVKALPMKFAHAAKFA
jgi:hypothetical protein